MKRATKCPGCGEPVSAFAAGCAVCGADLEQHRRDIEARRVDLPHVPRAARRSSLRFDAHVALVALVLLATLLSPFLALIMAAVGAQDRHRNGQLGQRNLFIGLAILNLALSFFPALRLGLYSLLY
ncbi:MAG TPA: hypothetical protein VF056_06025 [Thermoleophilaceae bacterium]